MKKNYNGWFGSGSANSAGRFRASLVALLLAVMIIVLSVTPGGTLIAYADDATASASDVNVPAQTEPSAQPTTTAHPTTTTQPTEAPAEPEEKHVCVITGFSGHDPLKPFVTLQTETGIPAARLCSMLPRTVKVTLACEGCPTTVPIRWDCSSYSVAQPGEYIFTVKLDKEHFCYVTADDPETEDIDESCTAPWCSMPYAVVVTSAPVAEPDEAASPSDVSASDVSASDISASDVSASDAPVSDAPETGVSASDAPEADTSASDVSATDVSASDVSATDVSASDASGNEVSAPNINICTEMEPVEDEPVCTCGSHCYANAAEGAFVVDITCPACSLDPSACAVAPEMTVRTLEAPTGDGRTVVVTGELPASASLVVSVVPEDEARQLIGEVKENDNAPIFFAYDIKLLYEGRLFQPGDYDRSVIVEVRDLDVADPANFAVFHVGEESVEQVPVTEAQSELAAFEAEGFSVYVGSTQYDYPALTKVYLWRYNQNANTADHYFSTDVNNLTGTKLTKTPNGSDYIHTVEELLNCYKVAGCTLEICVYDTYCSNSTETIDGTGANITFTHHPNNNGNLLNARTGATLTLRNVTLNAQTSTVYQHSPYATVRVDANCKLVIDEGTRLINNQNHAVFLNASSTLEMNGGEISGSYKTAPANSDPNFPDAYSSPGYLTARGAGVFAQHGSTFTMNGGTITGTNTADYGGAVYLEELSNFIMKGGVISGISTAQSGGAVYAEDKASFTMSGGTIQGCSVGNNGGAVYGESGAKVAMTVGTGGTGGTIENCTAVKNGGGVFLGSGINMTMGGGNIVGCSATNFSGGAVYVSNNSSFAMSGGTIENCSTGKANNQYGGAVFLEEVSSMSMTDGLITGCSSFCGGAVYITPKSTFTMSNGTFDGNRSIGLDGKGGAGGGAVVVCGTFTMHNGTFRNNRADGTPADGNNGGAIFVNGNGTFTMNNGLFENNYAIHAAGAIWNGNKTVINSGIIRNNTCETMGAGVFCFGTGRTWIMGGDIYGNHANNPNMEGGGIFVYNYNSSFQPELILSGSPLITDIVTLSYYNTGCTGDIKNRDISVLDSFAPRSVINIALHYSDLADLAEQEVLSIFTQYEYEEDGTRIYATRDCTTSDIANFAMVDPGLYLYKNPNTTGDYRCQVLVGVSNGFSYYKAGATGTGLSPASPTGSMTTAYNNLKEGGGTIYMMSDFAPTGTATLNQTGIVYGGTTVNMLNNSRVSIKRYSEQGSNTAGTNTGALFTVNEGATLNLSNIVIDGHSKAQSFTRAGVNYQAQAVTSASTAAFVVNGGTLNLGGFTTVKDTPASPKGGAVYVTGSGTVNINGSNSVRFDNGMSTVGKVVYVDSNEATVYMYGEVEIGNGDFHLETAASKLTVGELELTSLANDGVLPVTVSDTLMKIGGNGRVVATYTGGASPDLDKIKVTNATTPAFELLVSGQDVILYLPELEVERELTAVPEGVTSADPSTCSVDLAELYGAIDFTGKTLSMSLGDITGGIEVIDSEVIEANKSLYGSADAEKKFGLTANGSDVATGEGVTLTSGTLNFTLHCANAILTTGDEIGVVDVLISIDGVERTIHITLNKRANQLSASVPLKITGVVSTSGTFTMPSKDVYKINNNSNFPIRLTNVSWQWEVGADAMFANYRNLSSTLSIFNAGSYSFTGMTPADGVITGDGSRIAAESDLPLDWSMALGSSNYIKDYTTATVANISYTIEIC